MSVSVWLAECLSGRLVPVLGGSFVHHLSMHHEISPLALATAIGQPTVDGVSRLYLLLGGEHATADYLDRFAGEDREDLVLVAIGHADGSDAAAALAALADVSQFPVQVPEGLVSPRSVGIDARGRLATGAAAVAHWMIPLTTVAARESVRQLTTDGKTGSWQRVSDWLTTTGRLRGKLGVVWSDDHPGRSWSASVWYAAGVYLARYGVPPGLDLDDLLGSLRPLRWASMLASIGGSPRRVGVEPLLAWLRRTPGAAALVRPGADQIVWLLNDGHRNRPVVHWIRPERDGVATDVRLVDEHGWADLREVLGRAPVLAMPVDHAGRPVLLGVDPVAAPAAGMSRPIRPAYRSRVRAPLAVGAGLPAQAPPSVADSRFGEWPVGAPGLTWYTQLGLGQPVEAPDWDSRMLFTVSSIRPEVMQHLGTPVRISETPQQARENIQAMMRGEIGWAEGLFHWGIRGPLRLPRAGEFIYVAFIRVGFTDNVDGRQIWLAGASGVSVAGWIHAPARNDATKRLSLDRWSVSPRFGGAVVPEGLAVDHLVGTTLSRPEPAFGFSLEWRSDPGPYPPQDFPLEILKPENLRELDKMWRPSAARTGQQPVEEYTHLVQRIVNRMLQMEGLPTTIPGTNQPWLPVAPVVGGPGATHGFLARSPWRIHVSDIAARAVQADQVHEFTHPDRRQIVIHEFAHAMAELAKIRRLSSLLASPEQVAEVLGMQVNHVVLNAWHNPMPAEFRTNRVIDFMLGEQLSGVATEVVQTLQAWQRFTQDLERQAVQADRINLFSPAVRSWLSAQVRQTTLNHAASLYRYWQLRMEKHAFDVDRIARYHFGADEDWSLSMATLIDALRTAGWPTPAAGSPNIWITRTGLVLWPTDPPGGDAEQAALTDVDGEPRRASPLPTLSIRLSDPSTVERALDIVGSAVVGANDALDGGYLIELELPAAVEVTPEQVRRWAAGIEVSTAVGLVLGVHNLTEVPQAGPDVVGLQRNGRYDLPAWSTRIIFAPNGTAPTVQLSSPAALRLLWTEGLGFDVRLDWYLTFVDNVAWVRPKWTTDRFPTCLGEDGVRRRVVADSSGVPTYAVGASEVDLIPYHIYAFILDASSQLGPRPLTDPVRSVAHFLNPIEHRVEVSRPDDYYATAHSRQWELFEAVFGEVENLYLLAGEFDSSAIGSDPIRLLVELGSLADAPGPVEQLSNVGALDPHEVARWRQQIEAFAHSIGVGPDLTGFDARKALLFTGFAATVGFGVGTLTPSRLRSTQVLLDKAGLSEATPENLSALLSWLRGRQVTPNERSMHLRTAVSLSQRLSEEFGEEPGPEAIRRLRDAFAAADAEISDLVASARRGPDGNVWWLGPGEPTYPPADNGSVVLAYDGNADGLPVAGLDHNPPDVVILTRLVAAVRATLPGVGNLPIILLPVGRSILIHPGLHAQFDSENIRLGLNSILGRSRSNTPASTGLLAAMSPIASLPPDPDAVGTPRGKDPAAGLELDPRGVSLPDPLVELLRAPSWEAAAHALRDNWTTLVSPDVVELLRRLTPRFRADRRYGAIRTALELELSVRTSGASPVRVGPAGHRAWDVPEPAPAGPIGATFVFDYLSSPGQRQSWDGLLMALMVAKTVSFAQGLRIARALDGPRAAANAQVFTAVTKILTAGPAGLPAAKKLVSWEDCKLHPDDKVAWLIRIDRLRPSQPARISEALNTVADVLADCG